MSGSVLFVGREVERGALEGALAEAASGRGGVTLLTGAAGIGKTRLASELASGARDRFDVLWASCGPAGAMPPFWPWRQVLGDLLRRRPAMSGSWAAAARLVAGSQSGERADHDQARAELFEDVMALLEAGSAAHPLLVVLDDLHDADPSSWLLLAHLAARLPAMRVAVIGTWRTGDTRMFLPAARRVLRESRAVAVPPLDVDAVTTLAASLTGRAVAAPVAAAVCRRTSGNPLLTSEVVAELGARGRLDDAAAVDEVVPDSARALVAERLDGLPEETRAMLAVAAAIGTAFAPELVGEAAGAGVDAVLDGLAAAVPLGVVGSLGAAGGRFTHDVVRDAVLETVGPAARARLHRSLGAALERRREAGRGVEPVELARHFGLAGPEWSERAARYAREAGDRAMAMLAFEEAARWYEAASAAIPSATSAASTAEVLLSLGEARDAAGDRAGARDAFVRVAAAARAASRPDLLASAALGVSGSVGFEISLLDREQIDLLREALTALPDADAARRAAVMARLSVAVSFVEDAGERQRMTESAVQLARDSGDPFALVQALAARCDALAGPDYCEIRTSLATEIVALGTALREPQFELLGRRLLLVALLEQGRMAAADREILLFGTTVAAVRRPLYGWYVPLWRAMRALMEGRKGDVERALAEAENLGVQAGSANAALLAGNARWLLLAEEDRGEDIDTMLAGIPLESFPGVWPMVTRALAAAQAGRCDQARVLLDAVAPQLPGAERDSEWLPAITQLAEAVAYVGTHPVASWAYEALLPYRAQFVVEGIGAAVRGSVERYLGVLAASLGRRAEAVAHFDAAVSADSGLGAALLVARDYFDAGVALDDPVRLHSARERYAALGLDRRVAAVDARLGGAHAGGAHPRGAHPGGAPAAPNAFVLEGEVWRIRHGRTEVRLKDSKGLRDLARLLAEPGRPIAAVDLAAGVAGVAPVSGDLGEVLDARARDAYRRRLADLDEEIDDADRSADSVRSARASAEKEALIAQLAAAYGLGRRPRRAGDPAERARQTVSARVRDALERITASNAVLGKHLMRSVRLGRVCVYEPDSEVAWEVSPTSPV